ITALLLLRILPRASGTTYANLHGSGAAVVPGLPGPPRPGPVRHGPRAPHGSRCTGGLPVGGTIRPGRASGPPLERPVEGAGVGETQPGRDVLDGVVGARERVDGGIASNRVTQLPERHVVLCQP